MEPKLMPTEPQSISVDDDPAATTSEVDRLIAIGKAKQAVQLAKDQYKELHTPQTEDRLIRAYVARIEQFQSKSMTEEAGNLLAMVSERFPARRDQFARSRLSIALPQGKLADVLAPLALEQTPPEEKRYIENLIRQKLTDLGALAASDVLPANHPLRESAVALWQAFEAVTTRAVKDSEIALPIVSHRSPLAHWKLLIRGIAAFYRWDDAEARRALGAIAKDSAVAPIASTLQAMIEGVTEKTGLAAVLQARVVVSHKPLCTALEALDSALSYDDLAHLQQRIREAVRQCSLVLPGFLDRLKQHISVVCALEEVPVGEVAKVIGSTRKDAYFWRLLARAMEGRHPPAIVALFWERFLQHAQQEGMFSPGSDEAAVVWLKIADLLALETVPMNEVRRRLSEMDPIGAYYDDQPPEIAALRPKSARWLAAEVIDPNKAFARSAAIRPRVETFRQWWNWADSGGLADKFKEDIATQWHKSLPRACEPLVLLSSLAERRKALAVALKRLTQAETIDPLSPQVRQARLRLTLATTWRHFQDRKPHLVEADLGDLAALPIMSSGHGAAVLSCLRAAWHVLRNENDLAAQAVENAVSQTGPLVGPVVFVAMARLANLRLDQNWPPLSSPVLCTARQIAQAAAKIARMAQELQLDLHGPRNWNPMIERALRERPCSLSSAELLLVGNGAAVQDSARAYLASAAGLTRQDVPALTARFLLLRARGLAFWWSSARATQCLRAALDLARSARDEELIADIIGQVERNPQANRIILGAASGHGLTREVLDLVLEREREAATFPTTESEANAYLVEEAGSSGKGWSDDGIDDMDDDDEDDAYDDSDAEVDDAGFTPFGARGLPIDLQKKLHAAMERDGITPEYLIRHPRKMLELLAGISGIDLSPTKLKSLGNMLEEFAGGDDDEPPHPHRSKRKRRRRD
jgi:hypothetical protein